MERGTIRQLTLWLLAGSLAALWLYAAAPKLADPESLHAAIATYRMLPRPIAAWLAVWLPWVEVSTAVLLLRPGWRSAGFTLTLLLMAIFIVAIVQAWLRGLDITCGCFGGAQTSGASDYAFLILRDFALACVAWAGLRIDGGAVNGRS